MDAGRERPTLRPDRLRPAGGESVRRHLTEGRAELREGMVVADRFRIVKRLGDGAMGTVWHAHHLGLGRDVALKVLHPEMHAVEDHRGRFRREARAAGTLDHPSIVQPLDFGRLLDGRDFLVMQYVEGQDLHQLLRAHHRLPWAVVVRLATQVADALAYVHERGLIHRDLKPDNLMIEGGDPARGRVRILDLGLARFDDPQPWDMDTDPRMLVGSLGYAAPEQLHGGDVDPRADLYALGAVMYRALTGRRPLGGHDLAEVMDAQLRKSVPPVATVLDEPGRPPTLDRLIEQLLRRDPTSRPASAREVVDVLQSIRLGPSGSLPAPPAIRTIAPDGRRRSPWVMGLACFGAGVATGSTLSFFFA